MRPAIDGVLVPLDELRHGADWSRWRELTATAPPFLTPEFFALTRPLAGAGAPLVAEARRDDRVVGALPLVLEGDTLRALRSDHTPEYDYCGTPEGLAAIWARLRGDRRWARLVLHNVPAASPLVTQLPALARRDGCPVVTRPGVRHPRFALPGFEAALTPKMRGNLQRWERKAGGLELERILLPGHADLAEAWAIEGRAWKDAAGTAIAADPKVAHLYAATCRLFGRRGEGALYFLRAGGRRIATLLAVEDGRTLYALKIGFDPALSSIAPGHLIIWKVAADAERRGLAALDFVGHDDEWKQRWTHDAALHVTLVVYRRSPRGLARYLLHEIARPAVARHVPDWRSPLPRRCQRADVLGVHAALTRARDRVARGFGIRSGLRAWRRGTPRRPAGPGEPSRFEVGAWVRVRDADAVRATLDARGRLRGLAFVPSQWETCGRVYRVAGLVRRIRDDHGRFRAVARTVLLDGVSCAGAGETPTGCGRHCPMMYRDEWLEPAPAPRAEPPRPSTRRHARVRALEEIQAGLDLHGRRDGLTFMPEMAALAGRRFEIAAQLREVYEHDRWIAPPRPLYILAGLHCSGAVLGGRGPCDRACALVWHADWLILEPETSAPS